MTDHENAHESPAPEAAAPEREIPLGIVIARILVVSGMGIAAALAIFFLVGAIWLMAIISLAVTVVFMALMFGIERLAQ